MTEPETSTSRLPGRIGPYEITRRLGAGGMAETFEGKLERHGGFEKRACIKRILYPYSSDPVFREEFLQEARVLAQLDHPGIVDAYDYGEDDGHLYLVMKLVDGVNFAQLLDHYHMAGRRMPPGVVAYVGAQVAEALHHLHHFVDRDGVARNIVHRDVSPSNVVISRTGHVVLLDLGIATFAGRPKLTQTNHMKGKLGYMSPEHIEKHRGLDARSDLFSLGAMLYEGFAAERPFEQPTQIGTHHAILEGKFPPLLNCAPHLDPPELAELVEQALSPDKERRPSTGLELAFRLRMLAPHPNPQATLAAAVAECRDGTPLRKLAASATFYTGDPLAQAVALAAKFQTPTKPLSVADTALSVTTPRAPAATAPRPSALPAPPAKLDDVNTAEPATPAGGTHRARTAVVALLLLAALGAFGIAFAFRDEPEPPQDRLAAGPSKSPPSGHQAKPPAAVAPAPPPSLGSSPVTASDTTLPLAPGEQATAPDGPTGGDRPTNEPAEPRKRRGNSTGAIKVRVINWGYIWLDGEFKGKSPMVFDNLTPGVHEIGAGQTTDKPTVTEKVNVRPGQYLDRPIQLNEPLFK